ncbi:hypothetical protein K0M31_006781 [Melipona bicolor]|uniref:Uncharacterized protein n=1 Tax=Melipona bicolor TaxID=60889 RepID=A0AA40FSY7_9HYME|nr:hypothetical protein K0M31_006781 [Melipona bicolor]
MAAKSHITKLEAMQSIILRTIANALWYIKNKKDLQIPSVWEEIQPFSYRYKDRTTNHPNPLANTLYMDNITGSCYSLLN